MTLRRKLAIAGVYWLAQATLVYVVCAVLWRSTEYVDPDKGRMWGWPTWGEVSQTLVASDYVMVVLACTGIMALVQGAFLWPVRKPTTKDASGVSVFVSLAAAGLLVAVLAAAAVIAAAQFVESYTDWNVMGPAEFVVVGTLGVSWIVSTFMLVTFCQGGPRERVVQRLASRLLLGTVVEIAAIIPLDVLVRKRESCYCWAGTYFALLACGAVGLIVLGPAVVLPLVIRRRKRWYAGRCDACGYDMSRMMSAERCPECGAGWEATAAQT
jgi:hypothetical protein